MTKGQLVLLLLAGIMVWAAGLGLIPLLPLWASELGAEAGAIGSYLAGTWLMIALGCVIGGWISDRSSHCRNWLLMTSIASPLCIVAMSFALKLWQLAVPTALLWLFGGIYVAMSRVMVSRGAGPQHRGGGDCQILCVNGPCHAGKRPWNKMAS